MESPQPWWAQLASAMQASAADRSHRYAQLATVTAASHGRRAGRPAVRTVNIREFADRRVSFVTDTRSAKARDVREHAGVELAWYFPEVKMQFRLSGALSLRCGEEASEEWERMHDGQRAWWGWPCPAESRAAEEEFGEVPQSVPAHFAVAVLQPDYVDVLDLKVVPYMREVHECKAGEWTIEAVNP